MPYEPPMQPFERFFTELDARWVATGPAPITLRVLGSTALFLRTNYQRGTKDSDVIETAQITPEIRAQARALGGKGSPLHLRHGVYVDFLPSAFPFLPEEPLWHPVASPTLTHFCIEALDVVDVAVAKLARFHKFDQIDIAAMAERELIDPCRFTARFRSAVQRLWHDARADTLPRIVRHFHQVQRDELFIPESSIDLPPWVSDD